MTTLNRKEQEILDLLTSNNLDVDKINTLSSTLHEQDAKEVKFLLNVRKLNEQMKDKDRNIQAAEYFYYIDKNKDYVKLFKDEKIDNLIVNTISKMEDRILKDIEQSLDFSKRATSRNLETLYDENSLKFNKVLVLEDMTKYTNNIDKLEKGFDQVNMNNKAMVFILNDLSDNELKQFNYIKMTEYTENFTNKLNSFYETLATLEAEGKYARKIETQEQSNENKLDNKTIEKEENSFDIER